MSPAVAQALEGTSRAHIAQAGTFYFVCEFKRKLDGYPLWKTIVFRLLMRANRIASARLQLPTIIRYGDNAGAFWTEYLGGFTDRELALRVIHQMRAENPDRHFELTDLPLNGVLPGATGRWTDQDFPGDYLPDFYKSNAGPVLCPHKGKLCNPDETLSSVELVPLFRGCAGVDSVLSQ